MAKHWRSLKYTFETTNQEMRPTYASLIFHRIWPFYLNMALVSSRHLPYQRERSSSGLHLPTWTWIVASQRHRDRLKFAHWTVGFSPSSAHWMTTGAPLAHGPSMYLMFKERWYLRVVMSCHIRCLRHISKPWAKTAMDSLDATHDGVVGF